MTISKCLAHSLGILKEQKEQRRQTRKEVGRFFFKYPVPYKYTVSLMVKKAYFDNRGTSTDLVTAALPCQPLPLSLTSSPWPTIL